MFSSALVRRCSMSSGSGWPATTFDRKKVTFWKIVDDSRGASPREGAVRMFIWNSFQDFQNATQKKGVSISETWSSQCNVRDSITARRFTKGTDCFMLLRFLSSLVELTSGSSTYTRHVNSLSPTANLTLWILVRIRRIHHCACANNEWYQDWCADTKIFDRHCFSEEKRASARNEVQKTKVNKAVCEQSSKKRKKLTLPESWSTSRIPSSFISVIFLLLWKCPIMEQGWKNFLCATRHNGTTPKKISRQTGTRTYSPCSRSEKRPRNEVSFHLPAGRQHLFFVFFVCSNGEKTWCWSRIHLLSFSKKCESWLFEGFSVRPNRTRSCTSSIRSSAGRRGAVAKAFFLILRARSLISSPPQFIVSLVLSKLQKFEKRYR